MHAKPDLRVFLKWTINRSGSVITAVIPLNMLQSSKSTWRAKETPNFCERMIGFSVPNASRDVLLICYDGLKIMNLSNPITVRSLPVPSGYDPFDFYPESSMLTIENHDWQIIGLEPGNPIAVRPNGQKLSVDETKLEISIADGGTTIWSDSYENFSGDWVAATFSSDDWYIVLGCPYDFDFRVWERKPNA